MKKLFLIMLVSMIMCILPVNLFAQTETSSEVKPEIRTGKGRGKLSKVERLAAKKAREERKANRLKRFDTDKDGKLNEAEKAAAKKAREERKANRLKRFDNDKDGKLNEAERAVAKKAREERKAKKSSEKKP